MHKFKIRASGTSSIMAYPDKNEVPKGAITYLHQWVKEQLYSRRKEFTSKYTDKGCIVENDEISFAASVYDWGMVSKNVKHFSNEYMTGTPDVILADLIPDLKASWDCFTFPLFDTKLDDKYWWQMQSYMALTGKENAAVIYCLMDAPDSVVEREAYYLSKAAGYDELEMEFFDKVKANMTYSHLPESLRIKRFDVSLDDKAIKQIEARVKICAEYITGLNVEQFFNQLKAA